MTDTPRRRGCLLRLFLLVILIFVLPICALFFFLAQKQRSAPRAWLTPTQRAEMDRFLDNPLPVPKKWFELAHAPADVVIAASAATTVMHAADGRPPNFIGSFEQLEPFREKLSDHQMTPEDWKVLGAAMQAYEPTHDALIALASMPSYPGARFKSQHGEGSIIIYAIPYLGRHARWRLHRGDSRAVLEDCLLAWKLWEYKPPVGRLGLSLASMYNEIFAPLAVAAATRESDIEFLRNTLREMNSLVVPASPPPVHEEMAASLLLDLAQWQDSGRPVRMEPGMTGGDLLHEEIVYGTFGYYGYGVGARLERFVSASEFWGPDSLFSASTEYHQTRIAACELLGLRRTSEELEYLSWKDDSEPTEFINARRLAGLADYDLARLAIAARIEELEGRPRPTRMADVVPRCFESPLLDPFSGKPYPYSATHEVFYSVGPDGRDEGMARRYELDIRKPRVGDWWLEVDDYGVGVASDSR